MRNLLSLQRRVWTLETPAVSTDRCVAFAYIPSDSQVFFLRESGRIESLQLEEQDEQVPTKDLELLLDLREFLEDSLPSVGHWRWMNYVEELSALVCVSTSGAIVSVDVEALDGEEVGGVDSGLRAVAWSDNQEMLALVTGAGSLLIMSNDWEVLHETEIEACLPSELQLGSCDSSEESWCCELCWREDSKFIAVNVATKAKEGGAVVQKVLVFTEQLEFHALGRLEDGRAIPGLGTALDWSQSLALIASSEVRKGRLVVVFFERNGLRHGEFVIPALYRAPDYRVGRVNWNASSDTLAVSLFPVIDGTNGAGDRKQKTVVQLWSRNNYHWYLKQELQLPSEDELVGFYWDEDVAGRFNLVTCSSHSQALTLYEHEFIWDICGVEAEWPQLQLAQSSLTAVDDQEVSPQRQSVAVTGVIDGSKLLLTPLHRAIVPPPFALLQATFDAAINSVVFDSKSEALLVLLANGAVLLVENYLTPADARTSAAGLPPPPNGRAQTHRGVVSMSITTITLPCSSPSDEDSALGSLLWVRFCVESRQLVFAGKAGRQDQLVICSVDSVKASTESATVRHIDLFNIRRACEVQQTLSSDNQAMVEHTTATLAVQTHNGAVYTLNDETLVPTQVSGKFPAFSHLTVLDCRSTVEQRDLASDSALVIGLEGSSARLYVNGDLFASACSSFRYSALSSVLLFTTQGREPQLRIAPLNGLRHYSRDQAASTGSDTTASESRAIERGALLVATVGQRAGVIVQMPRGNLECMSPRLLVLALVVKQIRSLEYVAALELCRRHRLDLNVLVDFDPRAFLKNFSRFLLQRFLSARPAAVTSDRLCLFVTNLHPVDVWATKYGPLLEPFDAVKRTDDDQEESRSAYAGDGKVNTVCQALMSAIQERETSSEGARSALLLPFVTSAVKQSPPRFDEALGKIQKLLHRDEGADDDSVSRNRAAATRAIKHLIMLTDVDSLYSEALGLYDLELVRTVATHSQRDPKEYVPFLDRVARLEDEHWRKFTIDEHLGRHERALTHLAALLSSTSDGDEEEQRRLQNVAVELIQQGKLFDQALELFPHATRSASQSERGFRQQILRLKGDFLETEKKYEAAAYVYLSASEQVKARRAFIAANKWQMALALSARDEQDTDKLRGEAYAIAQELLNRQQQQQDGAVEDILAVARIYVEYCNDVDEAVALLVTHQQWAEALRVAFLHKRDDLVESDVETGVLQCCDDVQDELERKEKLYVKHWKRLTTIREQKRLFKLHGIDGSRWDQGNGGDGDTDAGSIRSGASSAADSALSNVSMSSVGSHNSAASIGNFSMQSLSLATSSHFYATQALGNAGKKPKMKAKHGGIPSRRERRNRMKEGSAEEEAYVAQQLSELRPNAALAREVGALLEMLVFFGHTQQAQKLQTQLAGFEECIADKRMPAATGNSSGTELPEQNSANYPEWRLAALQG